MIVVTYNGFLQRVRREFETRELALRWLRMCGKEKLAVITGSENS